MIQAFVQLYCYNSLSCRGSCCPNNVVDIRLANPFNKCIFPVRFFFELTQHNYPLTVANSQSCMNFQSSLLSFSCWFPSLCFCCHITRSAAGRGSSRRGDRKYPCSFQTAVDGCVVCNHLCFVHQPALWFKITHKCNLRNDCSCQDFFTFNPLATHWLHRTVWNQKLGSKLLLYALATAVYVPYSFCSFIHLYQTQLLWEWAETPQAAIVQNQEL